jgi:Uma2 family endonuclease
MILLQLPQVTWFENFRYHAPILFRGHPMATAFQRKTALLSVAMFRGWAESRPDEEHWELIDGVPVMMAPPTHDHQRIASNLERLLNDAIKRLPRPPMPPRAAYQRIGVNLGPVVEDYDPEPDVVVVDIAATGDQRYADRFYLVAEVVSSSDETKIESKREIYKRHPDCECVLVIRQDRYEVIVDLRQGGVWGRETCKALHDRLNLPAFGLQCSLKDIYEDTIGPHGSARQA